MKNKRKEAITMSNEWKTVRLGDEFLLQMGKTPDRQNVQYWNDGTNKWISIADIDSSKYLDTTKETISDIALKESGIKQIPQNTVIMSFKLSIGKVCITKDKMYSNEAIMAFIPKVHKNYDTSFLYYRLLSHNWILGLNKAVKGITLNKASLNDTEILFPKSLARQREIAAVLDKASELVEKRKAQLAELDRLAESVFYDMFGDPVTNPKGWGKKKFSVLGKVTTGNTPSRQIDSYYDEDYIEWIKTDNILNGVIHPTTAKEYLSSEGFAMGRSVNTNSLLITCIAGSLKSIGTVCLTDRAVAFNQQINAFTPNVDVCNYLFMWCLIRFSKKYIQDNATKGMKRIITKSVIEKLSFINPPLLLQQQFAERIEKIEEQKAKAKEALKESENLFQRLMQGMFNPEYHNS